MEALLEMERGQEMDVEAMQKRKKKVRGEKVKRARRRERG